jgi:hypothetical protein
MSDHILSQEAYDAIIASVEKTMALNEELDRLIDSIADGIADEVMASQADVQAALGMLRLVMRNMDELDDFVLSTAVAECLEGVEEKLDASLDKAHALLGSLGREMPPRRSGFGDE